jgi:hypothetical protein
MKWLLILSAACASIVLLMLGCGKSSRPEKALSPE